MAQKDAIDRVLVTNTTATAKHIRLKMNSLPDEDQHIDPCLGESVERHVQKMPNIQLASQMSGINMMGKPKIQTLIMRKMCESRLLQDEITLHNSDSVRSH